jgi:hypothetical protein
LRSEQLGALDIICRRRGYSTPETGLHRKRFRKPYVCDSDMRVKAFVINNLHPDKPMEMR